MAEVVLIIHIVLALGIIGLVLIQRSEGGGLGIGGGGGMGSLATAQGTASLLTKVTTIFAFCFFGTSLLLGVLAGQKANQGSILDELDAPVAVIEEIQEDVTPPDMPEEAPSAPIE